MNSKLKHADLNNKQNLLEAESRFNQELKKSRDLWSEQEKEKREQFIATKTKEIKELTIKGLEPELQRMMRKSKEDLGQKEKEFNDLLKKEKELLMNSFDQKLHEQKLTLLATKDTDITHERESLSVKLKENWEL